MSKEKSKIALITGITGQDGSYLAELLLEKTCAPTSEHRRSMRTPLTPHSHPSCAEAALRPRRRG